MGESISNHVDSIPKNFTGRKTLQGLSTQELTPYPSDLRTKIHGYGGAPLTATLDGSDLILTWVDNRDNCLWMRTWSSEGTLPISPIAPCTQVGWGVVNMSNVELMFEHLAGIETMPDRPADVVACMEANQAIREAYWGD